MSRWQLAALALLPFAVAAESGASVERKSVAGAEAAIVTLDGELVSAAGANGTLWLLVTPAGEADAPRRLLRWSAAEPGAIEERAAALPGWIKTLAVVELAGGAAEPELVAGGLGVVATLGPLPGAGKVGIRTLVEDPDLDLRSLARRRLRLGPERTLAVADAGRWRLFAAAGDGMRAVRSGRLPLAVEIDGGGLRQSSPPATRVQAAAGDRLLVGPEARGRTRLRTLLVALDGDDQAAPVEAWSRLPGPEAVEQYSFLELDGRAWLAVRTQGSETLNLFEEQRLRVLPLAEDRTRAGGAATFAVELDSKRWHELELAAADQNGDGTDDLLVARPEGIRGEDLVVEMYAGLGAGRFERRARRIDVDGPFDAFRFTDDLDGDGLVDLLTLGARAIELRRGKSRGDPIERAPFARIELPAAPKAVTEVSVQVGAESSASGQRRSGAEILGAFPRPGATPALLLALAGEEGSERIAIVVARPAPP